MSGQTPPRSAPTEQELVMLAQSVSRLKAALPALMEMAALEARVNRVRYEALMREGFTDAQALELLRGRGLS